MARVVGDEGGGEWRGVVVVKVVASGEGGRWILIIICEIEYAQTLR